MGRRIETGTQSAMLGPGGSSQEDYLGRLVKYVPTEIVGLYLAVNGVLPKAEPPSFTALWWVFGICWVLTPVYLWFATRDAQKRPLPLQVGLASIAFPVWVFAIGGPFVSLAWYQGYIASIVLFFVTFVFGFFKPAPGT